MEDLKSIIKELKSYSSLGLKADDNTILDVASRIFISQNISNQKRENIKEMKENKNFQPLTKSQFWYISNNTDMEKKEIESLSKLDASIIIKEHKEGKNAV